MKLDTKLDSMSSYTVADDRSLFAWRMMFHVWELLPHEYKELSWVHDINQDVIVIHHTSEERPRTSLWDALITVLPIACRIVVVCDAALLGPLVIREMTEGHKTFTFHYDAGNEYGTSHDAKRVFQLGMVLCAGQTRYRAF